MASEMEKQTLGEMNLEICGLSVINGRGMRVVDKWWTKPILGCLNTNGVIPSWLMRL